jgi:hypothetical protein
MKTINNNEYIIIQDDLKVEAWSLKNIPFEPKNWQVKMRRDMREALKALSSSINDKKQLYASYTTKEDNKSCDIENVLLYNIGSSVFTNICDSALCIERGSFGALISEMPHHYKYELVNKADFVIHKPQSILAIWDGTPLCKNDVKLSNLDASFFWNYIKESRVKVFSNEYIEKEKFGIEISIETPRPKINLSSIIKPLVDGVICAFHQHDGDKQNDNLHEISDKLGISQEKSKLLYDDELNVLGKRSLFTKSFQWNPADDLCDAIKLKVTTGKENWKIDGKILSV